MTAGARKEMGHRLRRLVESAGGVEAVVKALNNAISSSTLGRYVSGQSEMSAEKLALIADLVGSTVDYIVRGIESPANDRALIAARPVFDDEVEVPILDVQARAGSGGIDNGSSEGVVGVRRFSRARLRALGVNPDYVDLIHAHGDSMEPTIYDGSAVLVDRSRRDPRAGGIYAISVGDDLRLKRLRVSYDGGIVLISDNKEFYPEEFIPKKDAYQIKIHGRAFLSEKPL